MRCDALPHFLVSFRLIFVHLNVHSNVEIVSEVIRGNEYQLFNCSCSAVLTVGISGAVIGEI